MAVPIPQDDGSWNKSTITTHYENAFNPDTSRPWDPSDAGYVSAFEHTPWSEGESLSYDGIALLSLGLGYTKSEIHQEFNEYIWSEIGQLRLKTAINRSFTSDAAGSGTFASPVTTNISAKPTNPIAALRRTTRRRAGTAGALLYSDCRFRTLRNFRCLGPDRVADPNPSKNHGGTVAKRASPHLPTRINRSSDGPPPSIGRNRPSIDLDDRKGWGAKAR